jgi:Family of unknown function (DUF6112)
VGCRESGTSAETDGANRGRPLTHKEQTNSDLRVVAEEGIHMVTTVSALGVRPFGIVADVSPNSTGLPGIGTLSTMVGALLTVGLIACVAGLVLAAIVWAVGSHSSNPHLAGRGKSGVLVAFVAAVLIGGANVLVDFFVTTGKGI